MVVGLNFTFGTQDGLDDLMTNYTLRPEVRVSTKRGSSPFDAAGTTSLTRRRFLKRAVAAGGLIAATSLVPASALGLGSAVAPTSATVHVRATDPECHCDPESHQEMRYQEKQGFYLLP